MRKMILTVLTTLAMVAATTMSAFADGGPILP